MRQIREWLERSIVYCAWRDLVVEVTYEFEAWIFFGLVVGTAFGMSMWCALTFLQATAISLPLGAAAIGLYKLLTDDPNSGAYGPGATQADVIRCNLLTVFCGLVIPVVGFGPPIAIGCWLYQAVDYESGPALLIAAAGGTLCFSLWGVTLLFTLISIGLAANGLFRAAKKLGRKRDNMLLV